MPTSRVGAEAANAGLEVPGSGLRLVERIHPASIANDIKSDMVTDTRLIPSTI